jgi:hypothetical protein
MPMIVPVRLDSLDPMSVFACPSTGPDLSTGGDALDPVAEATEQGAKWVLIPAQRLVADREEFDRRLERVGR